MTLTDTSSALGELYGVPVAEMAVAFRNAGDGLSEALEIDPRPHETGTPTFWVLKCVTGPIDHVPINAKGKPAKGSELLEGFESYRRVEDQMTLQAIEVSEEQVGAWLAESAGRIAAVRAEAERRAAEEEEQAKAHAPLFGDDGEPLDELGDDEGGPGDPLRAVVAGG